jgi:D-galactarolactone isomerase
MLIDSRDILVQAGATTVEMLEPLSKRVNDVGWHVQLNLKPELLVQIEDLLLRSPSPRVRSLGAHSPRCRRRASGLQGHAKAHRQGAYLGKALRGLSGYEGRRADLRGRDGNCARLRQGRARAHGMGQRLAASDREGQARRRCPLRPSVAMGSRILVQNPEALYGFGRPA